MLKFIGKVDIPEEKECEFDHADVDQETGRVYVAHTSSGTVEVIDGKNSKWLRTIMDCAGGSGLTIDHVNRRIFAASRKEGYIISIDADSMNTIKKFKTGSKPNGLAVDSERKILMTADVGDNQVRFYNQETGEEVDSLRLIGRPRWCIYRKETDEYLINVMAPSGIELISGDGYTRNNFLNVKQKGPHGLVVEGNIAYVACDDSTLVAMDLGELKPVMEAKLAGPPDVLWYNRKQSLIYCSIGEPGIVQVFNAKTLELVQEVETEYGSHTLTFDENSQKLYTFLPGSHSVGIYQA